MTQGGFDNQYWTAKEACSFLGIKQATLYAYVSRGLVESTPGGPGRLRLYLREDLERLKARHDARRGHGPVAAAALRFGEPVLETRVGRIGPSGPEYRGVPVSALVDRPFEAVADHLFGVPEASWPAMRPDVLLSRSALFSTERSLDRWLALVPLIGLADPDRHALTETGELDTGRRLIRTMAQSLALPFGVRRVKRAASGASIAETVLVALVDRATPKAIAAVDRALVLSAEHELNPSTFAARIAASTGADLYAVLTAALATLSGPRHGAACDRVEQLVAEVGPAQRASAVLREKAQRGEPIPGFGHPLYPGGDPRTPPLLAAAQALAPKDPTVAAVQAIVKAMRASGRGEATIDLGLVAIAAALQLPAGSAAALFGLGRAAGWIAHAREQRASSHSLRPRARYVG